jgi:branched-chain amino acid transport system substrate-binding protein
MTRAYRGSTTASVVPVLVLLSAVVAAWIVPGQAAGQDKAASAPTPASAPAPAAPSGPDIKVGIDLPLSGPLVALGKSALDGVRLRVEEINRSGGVGGRKIALVVEDNRGEKADTRSAFKKLAEIDHVAAVIGPITSTNTFAAKIDAEQLHVPLISPTATNDKVTDNSHYIFRACFNDSFQGTVIATYAFAHLGVKKAGVMIDKNSDYSKGLSANFTKALESAGGQVVATEGYQQKDTDFGTQLIRIKNAGAQIIFVPGYPPELPLIIRQAKVVGFPGRLCGADGWDNDSVINNSGDNIEGCVIVGAFSPEDRRPIVKEFLSGAKAAFGRAPGTFEALGYDSLLLLGKALEKGTDRQALADALHGLKDVEGVTGKITLTPRGDALKSAVILKIVKDGDKYVAQYVDSIAPS